MKRAFITAGLLLGLALVAPPAQAQTGTARGKAVDQDGKPLAEVKVTIEFLGGVTRKYETKTNKKGEFVQVGMQPGPYRFTASLDRYRPALVETRISLGDPTVVPELRLMTAAAAAQEPDSAAAQLQANFKKAVELTGEGKLDEAEAAYKAILATDADVPEVHQNLGYIYQQKKDYANAEASYLKALELRPGSSEVAAGLARLYQDMGQPQKAMEVMNKAVAENPQDARAQFNRGIFLLNSGQSAEAIQAFEAAVAADPQMAEAYYHLGTLMVGQAKIPEAIQYLEKYLGMNPTSAQNVATAQGLLKAIKK